MTWTEEAAQAFSLVCGMCQGVRRAIQRGKWSFQICDKCDAGRMA